MLMQLIYSLKVLKETGYDKVVDGLVNKKNLLKEKLQNESNEQTIAFKGECFLLIKKML